MWSLLLAGVLAVITGFGWWSRVQCYRPELSRMTSAAQRREHLGHALFALVPLSLTALFALAPAWPLGVVAAGVVYGYVFTLGHEFGYRQKARPNAKR